MLLNYFLQIQKKKKRKKRILWANICSHAFVNAAETFLSMLIKYDIKYHLLDSYGLDWSRRFTSHKCLFIHGLSYKGSEESQIGEGTLYATPRYNKQDKNKDNIRPRHDFILIYRGEEMPPTLGCIILMFELAKKDTKITLVDDDAKIFLLVQILVKCTEKRKMKKLLGSEYEWAACPDDGSVWQYEIITAQSIYRPAMVIPMFTRINKIKNNQLNPNVLLNLRSNNLKPHRNDRFYFIERKFFDRSGWENVIINDNLLPTNTNADIERYITLNQTGFNDLNMIRKENFSRGVSSRKQYDDNILEDDDNDSVIIDDEDESGEDEEDEDTCDSSSTSSSTIG